MKSEIWRVQSEKIGSLEAFRSERDMESFLINNPAIVGCWDPDASSSIPALIREQISTLTEKFDKGRMDLVGLARTENGYELRIFELKAVEITDKAVDQLDRYLKGWRAQASAKEKIKKWVVALDLEGLTEAGIKEIVDKPVGVLVGPKFLLEAAVKAKSLKIRAVRLARFKAASAAEYYVIVEDEVGDVVDTSRRSWSWKDLAETGLISEGDCFVIRHGKDALRAKPDPAAWDWYKKKVIFDGDSTRKLIDNEVAVRARANKDHKRWLDKEYRSLKAGSGVFLSNAAGLCYLAFGGPTPTYWVSNWCWTHEKTGQKLDRLVQIFIDK
ncbi:MAG: hypothetical protein ABFD52_07390 [Acidobacteriota bacterium]